MGEKNSAGAAAIGRTINFVVAVALAAFALSAAAPVARAADCAGADAIPAAGETEAAAEATLCLVNEERAGHGLAPLARESVLDRASASYSQRMVAEAFFDHVSPDGANIVQRLLAAGYGNRQMRTWVVGENIAWGQDVAATPRSIVAQWMASPDHRRNVLSDRYAQIGIGIALGVPVDATWGATYTTDFGLLDHLRVPSCGEAATSATKGGSLIRMARGHAKARASACPSPGADSGRCSAGADPASCSSAPLTPGCRLYMHVMCSVAGQSKTRVSPDRMPAATPAR